MTVRFEMNDPHRNFHLYLEGAATFLNIPEIVTILEASSPNIVPHTHAAQFMSADHS